MANLYKLNYNYILIRCQSTNNMKNKINAKYNYKLKGKTRYSLQ